MLSASLQQVVKWHGSLCKTLLLEDYSDAAAFESCDLCVQVKSGYMLLQAYLRADEKLLAQHCTPEAVERLTSIVKAEHALVIICTLLSILSL